MKVQPCIQPYFSLFVFRCPQVIFILIYGSFEKKLPWTLDYILIVLSQPRFPVGLRIDNICLSYHYPWPTYYGEHIQPTVWFTLTVIASRAPNGDYTHSVTSLLFLRQTGTLLTNILLVSLINWIYFGLIVGFIVP